MSKSCGGCANPYGKADYQRLKDAQRKLADLLPVIDKVERCGVECDMFRQVARELQDRFSAIEKEFMTPIPK